jgi:FkbM family methyltransferase
LSERPEFPSLSVRSPLNRRLGSRLAKALVRLIGRHPHIGNRVLRGLLDRHLAPNVLCLVSFSDHALYVDPRDDKVALKLLSGKPWQRRELETAIATLNQTGRLKTGGVFVDVGANIGTQSIYALLSGEFARAAVFEPEPHNLDILRRNLAVNGLDARAAVIKAAATSQPGTLQLARHAKNLGAHSVEAAYVARPADRIDVAAVRVDDALAELGIAPSDVALVKIDVEGHEMSALAGMERLLDARVPVMVEFTAGVSDTERVAAFRALFATGYSTVFDLSAESAPQSLKDFRWQGPQADLLIY